jgi:hypothetical protein
VGLLLTLFFRTYYMQQTLGFTPIQTDAAFVPMTGSIILAAATVQTRILHRTGPKPVILAGMALVTIAMRRRLYLEERR